MIKHIEIKDCLGFTLRGYLDLPDNAKRIVVFFHGYTGNLTEHNDHFKLLSRMLSKENIASLRMCYAGNGESDGAFYDSNFANNLIDCKAMLDYAKNELKFDDICLLGFSMGGLLACCSANYIPITKIVLWSAAVPDYDHWKKHYEAYRAMPNGKRYFLGREVDERLYETTNLLHPIEEAKKFQGEVLIYQGRIDQAVPFEQAIKYNEAFKNSTLKIIENCTHGYDQYEFQKEILDGSLNFLKS